MFDEHSWSQFIVQVCEVLEVEDVSQLAILRKGEGAWDSLKTIQIYILLKQFCFNEINDSDFLQTETVQDFKRFFS